jgi:DMSO/TMAO reductase YedYZ heme-binding membrane subunit
MKSTRPWFEGWPLSVSLALAIALITSAIVLAGGASAPALGLAIRFTARTSFVLFGAAFTASALSALAPNVWTRWQRRNGRQLGVAFAASHFTHAAAIGLFAALHPEAFHEHTQGMSRFPGLIAYVFIAALAATSFDRSAAWLGRRSFRALHTQGSFYIWLSFLNAFLTRALHVAAGYWFPVALVLALLVVRLWAAVRARQRVTA